MASSLIHLCVANQVNKKIKRDERKLLIGSIAPDISKLVDEPRSRSHFMNESEEAPNIDRFLNKYRRHLNDDFVLGYYIHLYTDYLWEKYFVSEILNDNLITKLDGTVVKCTPQMVKMYIYNDYTNLNKKIIELYDLNYEIFYNELPKFENIIEEIPMDRLNVIVDQAGIIIANSKETKSFVIDITSIQKFIDLSTELISANLDELEIE